MIHYHGIPITPNTAGRKVIEAGHAFISFRYPEQLGMILESAQSFAADNGAFSAWRSGTPVQDWTPYYDWVDKLHRYPSFDFAVIPDVINGDEAKNDRLISEWPWQPSSRFAWVGAPVWHMHESLDRLEVLASRWPRICIGSSEEFANVGTQKWWIRIAEAMNRVCDQRGSPATKLHGLRMLDPEIFTRIPFASADSTNIAQNIGIDSRWKGPYSPANKEMRALVMRDRIEAHSAPLVWEWQAVQQRIFA